jgi:hypothetical protein
MSTPKPTIYRCPNKCGDSRYPQPKWTTQAGYDAHMAKCPKSPEAVAKKLAESEAAAAKAEADQLAVIAKAKHKIGDLIHYVGYRVVKPTHEEKRGRLVRVRYDEVRSYYAATDKIASIGFNGATFYNGSVYECDIHPTLEAAQKAAADKQSGHDEALSFARECR